MLALPIRVGLSAGKPREQGMTDITKMGILALLCFAVGMVLLGILLWLH